MKYPLDVANQVAGFLGLDTRGEPYATISYGLVNAQGILGAYISNSGALTLSDGSQLTGAADSTATRVRLATAAALDTCVSAGSGSGHTLTITATGTLTVDGVLTALANRILVKNQVAAADNGIYTVTNAGGTGISAVLTRAEGFDTWGEIPGEIISVLEGTANAGTIWLSTATIGGTLETTSITFSPFTNTASINSALTINSTTISGGTTTRVLYDNAGAVGEYTITGTGTVVAMATSPTFTTSIIAASTTMALFNTTATTINFGAAASTAINVGHASGTVTILGTTALTAGTFTTTFKSTTAAATPSALAATQTTLFASTVSGAAVMGYGTTNDTTLMNRAGTVVVGVGPNTTTTNFGGNLVPTTHDLGALGTTALGFADLFLATGGTLHFENTDWVATHSAGILTVGTGDLRVTTAGTNAASVVTVGGTQTLTNKTLTAPAIGAATGTSLVLTAGVRFTPTVYTSDGAITLASGLHLIEKTSAAAMTVAAPSSQDGERLSIISNTDFAHVVTFTGATLLDGTTGANLTVTMTAFKGSALTVVARGTKWLLESSSNVTSITV